MNNLQNTPAPHDVFPTQPAGMTLDEMGLGSFGPSELWWRDHYTWLLEQGYQLRERYKPDWVPSWKGRDPREAVKREDGQPSRWSSILDAVRVKDGTRVALKRIRAGSSRAEIENSLLFSSEKFRSLAQNHSVPIYDVLPRTTDEPQYDLIAIPVLRHLWDTPFATVGEVVACVRQLIEGLAFIHEHRVAHRDCHRGNIMMDATPMYPEGFHFNGTWGRRKNPDWTATAHPLSRTECSSPVKYYFIDFGHSMRYDGEGPALAMPIGGGDKTVPEFRGDGMGQPHDPFPTDVYYLGNALRQIFLDGSYPTVSGYQGLEFMRPFFAEMRHEDPSKRPTMPEVVVKFEKLVSGLGQRKLRMPVIPKEDFALHTFLNSFGCWKRAGTYWMKGLPAIPRGPEA